MKNLSALLVILMLALASVVQAQTVEDILDNYYETIGGVDTWKELNSMRMEGNSINQGMALPTTVISMRPNLQKVVVDIQGKQFIDCYDGETAWMLNPFMGGTDPQPKTEEESKEAADNMFEDELIDYVAKGHTLTLEGEEEVDGTKAHKLKLIKKNGDEVHYYIDAEVYVPIMVRSFIKTGQMKGQAVEVYFSDYEEISIGEGEDAPSVIIARSFEQKMNGQTFMQMTAEKIEFNPDDIGEEDFAFPKK